MGQHVQNQELILVKLNQMKKENPEQESYKIKDIVKKIELCLF